MKKERNWEKIYVAVDLHGVICPPDYKKSGEHADFYPYAKETLQMLSKRKDVCLILWTCSYPNELKETLLWLKDNDIKMDYVNENPECHSTRLGDFSKKFWAAVILDDKAGFEGETDWKLVKEEFQKHLEG